MKDMEQYFINPIIPAQKQYEAVRAVVIDKLSAEEVATKFNYSINTIYSLLRDVRSEKLDLFPVSRIKGPKERRTPSHIIELVVAYRKQKLSCFEIAKRITKEGYKISERTVENIISDSNLPRLARRNNLERGLTINNELIALKATALDIEKLEPFTIDCPVAGIFFFLPYLVESGVIDILSGCRLPESSALNAQQACLSMLLLKLIGSARLSHITAYDHEPAFGLFAGLNVLPKSTYMATYSCRTSEEMLVNLQSKIVSRFRSIYPEFYHSEFINLDFHSIPHFGDEDSMEKVWCGARGKAMKGANTLLAQDSKSNVVLYTNADVLRKNEAKAIQQFIEYWKAIKGSIEETLVFDCKLTTYKVLDEISDDVKFITLRKRNKKLLAETLQIPDEKWKKIKLDIPKRKHKICSVFEDVIKLSKCNAKFRQIIIKDHGRAEPTFMITNNHDLPLKEVLLVYAKRWHIENKISEMVSFFNLNALSSPLMIRIHFDILWTVVADTLYQRFSQDLPRFERSRANTTFRKFVDMPGKIHFDGNKFTVKIRKRATTPILLGVEKLKKEISIPWLNDKKMFIEWTA
jgi:transposase